MGKLMGKKHKREEFTEFLKGFCEPDSVDTYMEFLKQNPSTLLTSDNDGTQTAIDFKCGRCGQIDKVLVKEHFTKPVQFYPWECKICNSNGCDEDYLQRHVGINTMMLHVN
jgi:hypothetical protein